METHGKALMNAIDMMVSNSDFQSVIYMSERKKNEKYDFDLVIRYLCFKHSTIDELLKVINVGDYLNNKIVDLASKELQYDNEVQEFNKIFLEINQQINDKAFRRYKAEDDKFSGPFLMAQYESVIYGILKTNSCNNLMNKLKALSVNEKYIEYSAGGIAVKNRWSNLLKLAYTVFKDE